MLAFSARPYGPANEERGALRLIAVHLLRLYFSTVSSAQEHQWPIKPPSQSRTRKTSGNAACSCCSSPSPSASGRRCSTRSRSYNFFGSCSRVGPPPPRAPLALAPPPPPKLFVRST